MMMKTSLFLALLPIASAFTSRGGHFSRFSFLTADAVDRRQFMAGSSSGSAAAAAAALLLATQPALADPAAPGGVLGTWSLIGTIDDLKGGASLSFLRSGDAEITIEGVTYPSVRDWRADTAGRYLNDKGKLTSFSVELPSEVYFFNGLIEDSTSDFMKGTITLEGSGQPVGKFEAVLSEAAGSVKKRAAFQKFVPPEGTPVLELNGRARWQVEKEQETRGSNKPKSTPDQESSQSSVYLQLRPTDLKGYSYPTEMPAVP
jgi:hypothetical protein